MTYERFKKLFGLERVMSYPYNNCYPVELKIKGYKPLVMHLMTKYDYEKQCFGNNVLDYRYKEYTECGQDHWETIFELDLDEFDDNMTDEEIINKVIKICGDYLQKEER